MSKKIFGKKVSKNTKRKIGVSFCCLLLAFSLFGDHSDEHHEHTHTHIHHVIDTDKENVNVSTYEDLISALNIDEVKVITLTNSITLPDGAVIDGDKNHTGNRKVITAVVTGTNEQGAINANASDYSLFFVSKNATATIRNLTIYGGGNTAIVNGSAADSTNNNSTLYIDHVTISNSGSKTCAGGAIKNTNNCKLVLSKSTLLRNIANYGGGFDNYRGTMVVDGCSILENRSFSYGGGGGENTGDEKTGLSDTDEAFLYVYNTTIANNSSQEIGGGLNNALCGYMYLANTTISCNATTNINSFDYAGGGIGNNKSTLEAVNCLIAGNVQLDTKTNEISSSDVASYADNGSVKLVGTVYGSMVGYKSRMTVDGDSCYEVQDNDALFLSSTSNCVISSEGTEDSIFYTQSALIANSEGVLYAPLATESVASAATGHVKLALVTFDYFNLNNIDFSYTFETKSDDHNAGSKIDEPIENFNEIINVKVHSNNDFTITGGSVYGDSYLVDIRDGLDISLNATKEDADDKSILWYTIDEDGDYQLLSTANPYNFNTNSAPFSAYSHSSSCWNQEANVYEIDIYPVTFAVDAEALNKQVVLNWNIQNSDILTSGINKYDIYYSTINDFNNTTYRQYFGSTSTTTATIGNLTNGTPYYFWVVPALTGTTNLAAYTCAVPSTGEYVYVLTNSISAGKEYVVCNTNTASSSANILNGSSNAGSINKTTVKKAGNDYYIENVNSSNVFTCTSGYKLKTGSRYIYMSSSNLLNTSSHNLSYSNNYLTYTSSGTKYYLDLNNSSPSRTTTSTKVYLYEKVAVSGQAAPTGITSTYQSFIGTNSGSISGLTTDMEYSLDGLNWSNVTSTSMNSLNAGTYYFRYKANGIQYASPATAVSVLEKAVSSLTVKTNPSLSYTEGDKLDLSDLVVTIRYNDGTFKNVSYEDFASTDTSIYDRKNGVITTSLSNDITLGKSHNNSQITISLDGVSCKTNALSVSHNLVHVSASNSTCVAGGNIEYWYCSECGDIFLDADATITANSNVVHTSATGHSFVNVVTDPTCTTQGYTTHTCSTCGYSYVDTYVDALGHDYEISEQVAATCDEDGYITYVCSECGATYTEIVDALGHTYTSTIVNPTCTEKGYTLHTCECGESYKDTYVDALGHNYVETSRVTATCEENGYIEYTCSVCGDSYKVTLTKTGHTYVDVVTDPTCTTQGYTTHTCECGDSYVDTYVDALGHTYVVTNTVEPTCTTNGSKTYTCSVCGDTYTDVIPATGHSYTSTIVNPTCTEKGYTLHTCECGYSYKDTYIDALGHHYEETTRVAATCEENGYIEYTCSRCGDSYKVTLSATGHHYIDTVTLPTCTTQGYTTHTCECGDSYVDTYIDALGHDYEISEQVAATCDEDGYITYVCSECGATYTEVIDALGHSYTSTVVAPTCTEKGYTLHTCECGESYKDTYVDALGHNYVETDRVVATCEENGYIEYTCSVCGDSYKITLTKTGHTYVDVVTDPTCTTQGYTTHTCECGDSYVDTYVDALGHSYAETDRVNATCEENGYIEYTCSVCGDSYKVTLPATGHHYIDTVTLPTCTTQGYTTHTCECGDSYVDTYVDALGHTYVVTNIVEPTCTESGSKTYVCSVCGDTYTDVIDALGHSYTCTVIDSTCTEKGYTLHTCECGYSYKDTYVDALGHSYAETNRVAATCENDGYIEYTCSRCGDSYKVTLPATGHSYADVVTLPTCTSKGYTTHTCDCGYSYIDNYVNELGHQYIETERVDATYEGDGYVIYTCSRCGDTYQVTLPALSHSFVSVVTDPTCTEKGFTTYTCSECDYSYIADYVNPLGHTYEETNRLEPTCTNPGYIEYTCSRCGDVYKVTLPACGHTYSDVVINPTCTAQGYTTHTCTTCGNSYNDSYVDALGHSYEITNKVEATCLEDGSITYVCSRCGDTYTDVIPATGHHYTDVVTLPTCTSKGYTTHICECGDSYVDSYVDALGHHYVETERVPATCEIDGHITYTCEHCGDSYEVKIEAIGHSYVVVTSKEATESENGYVVEECEHCGDTKITTIKYDDDNGHHIPTGKGDSSRNNAQGGKLSNGIIGISCVLVPLLIIILYLYTRYKNRKLINNDRR